MATRLLLYLVQVNMQNGWLPPAEEAGQRFFRVPIDAL